MAKIKIARGHEYLRLGRYERRLLIETPFGNVLLVEGADGPDNKWTYVQTSQLSVAEAAEKWEKRFRWITGLFQLTGGGWVKEFQDPTWKDLELLWTKGLVRSLLQEGVESEEEDLRQACRWVLQNLSPDPR
jgi:hypothetical protein